MKKLFPILWLCLLFVPVAAQQRDPKQAYEEFKAQAQRRYSDFRDKANAEYADFVKQAWRKFNTEPAIPAPTPDPPVQPVYVPGEKPTEPRQLPYDLALTIDPVVIQPQPVAPIHEPQTPVASQLSFDFFGVQCTVHVDPADKVRMPDSSESAVSSAWRQLSDSRYNALLRDCLRLRDELQLCDWAYYQLTSKLSLAYCGSDSSAEAVVLQTYILTQSGYQVRLARTDDRLWLLLCPDIPVYARLCATLDGCKYFFVDPDYQGGGFHTCDFAFPGEQAFSLHMNKHPLLPVSESFCRVFQASRYPSTKVVFCPNQNLMDFYTTYPQCRWDVFALASLSDHAKEALYPVLKQAIAGKSEAEAANVLINFVQTAFEYETDDKQFGRERSLFADETLNYDYSDCEDRAILYSALVRELLGLDVVLLYYPDHLATAVHFNDPVTGDYLDIGGHRYIVCDPTYIGVDIGRTMPGMDNRTAEVIVL